MKIDNRTDLIIFKRFLNDMCDYIDLVDEHEFILNSNWYDDIKLLISVIELNLLNSSY